VVVKKIGEDWIVVTGMVNVMLPAQDVTVTHQPTAICVSITLIETVMVNVNAKTDGLD
jgi:hypothetical protein